MLNDKTELRKILLTVTELFVADKQGEISGILRNSEVNSELSHYDNWNGGTEYFSIYLTVPVEQFVKIQSKQTEVEAKIKEKIELILRPYENIKLSQTCVIPKSTLKIEWNKIVDLFSKDQLLKEIDFLKNTMISVSTGGPRIQDVNEDFKKRYLRVSKALSQLNIENPNPYNDLWQWYAKWSSGELSSYQTRRVFIGNMYGELLKNLQETDSPEGFDITINLSNWDRIDRSIREIKSQLKRAVTEEQFQTVGLLCRETIISLAQAVFDETKHPTTDGIKASRTDSKRMLDAYISTALDGSSNENIRRYARASNDVANELTHKRTANSKDAALCSAATVALVNLIGILEDRY